MTPTQSPSSRSLRTAWALAILLSVAVAPVAAAFQVPPRPRGAVHDGAGVIRPGDAQAIEAISRVLWERGRVGLVVAALPDLGGEPVEDVSSRIANSWGVGGEKDDRGILIVAAVEDRRARIEVGYGAEGYIPDGLAGEILDQQMIPFFRQGDYSSGLRAAVERVAVLSAREYGFNLEGIRISPAAGQGGPRPERSLLSRIFGILILLVLIVVGYRNPFLLLLLLGASRGGGFHRGGFGGGGFGGFGGGGFGGGGASRGW
jgi:uncharacterized protein